MVVPFSEGVADAFVRVVEGVASVLRGQGSVRHGVVSNAVEGLSGGYAKLFTAACVVEAEDRGRLAGVLDDLAADVVNAKLKAQVEIGRQERLRAWWVREEVRERRRELVPGGFLFERHDPKPSEFPVRPPSISAVFVPRQRQRVMGALSLTGAPSLGRSSADPDRLRYFVAKVGAQNAVMVQELAVVRNAWAGFVSACSWIVGRSSKETRCRRIRIC